MPKVQRDESRTQGLDPLELTRFLQVAQTITVHHGALAYLLGINALRASETEGPLVLRPLTGNPIDRARRLPDGHQDRQGGRHPEAHQPALAAARGDHKRLGCRGSASRRADPRPPRRSRTTEHYDRARGNLDRHAVHFLTAYVAGV